MGRTRIAIGINLFFLMICVYMLIYQGQLLLSDERTLFDSAQSFVRRGDFYPTYENNVYDNLTVVGVPWNPPAHEPLPIYVVVFFTLIGSQVPEIGLIHIALLMNILLSALLVVSFYVLALCLRYRLKTALYASLLLGLATNILPYTRTLFREPLMTFLIFWCYGFALLLYRTWKEEKRLSYPLLFGLLITAILAILSKVSTVFFLPGILIILLPSLKMLESPRQSRRFFIFSGLLIVILLIAAVLITQNPLLENTRYSWARWEAYLQSILWGSVIEAVLGYQISWGRSVWLYSPILVFALWGAWRLIRQGAWRMVVAPIVIMVLMSLFYGLIHRQVWWGGWGWGPRYFTSVIPLMMLWLLPIIEARRTTLQNSLFYGFVLLSVGMQLLGLAVPLSNFYTARHLSGHALFGGRETWSAINWSWDLGAINYHLSHLNFSNYDGAWGVVANGGVVALLIIVSIALAGGTLYLLLIDSKRRNLFSVSTVACLVALCLSINFGLYALRDDPRYIGDYADVDQLIAQLNTDVEPDSALFIDQPLYTQLFMNWFKSADLAVTLDYAPGEFYGNMEAVISSDNPAEVIGQNNFEALSWSVDHYAHLWFVASASPFENDKRRPIERYLVENYFQVQEINTSARARAIEFLTVDAPQGEPEQTTDFNFDDEIRLAGYTLPLGDSFRAGEVIPVSLLWDVIETPTFDYNVSLYLADESGALVAQRDGQPQATFGRMSRWQVGEAYRDNHGLQLPVNLPEGTYSLHIVVYNWQTQERLWVIGATNEEDSDSVLLGTINIQR
ncbi:MAG: hypothetical protein RLP44_09380 [Aggregatilineales bacterium]